MAANIPSVLIVDDEVGICDLLEEELSERGCRCGVAYNGETALSELAAKDYDIALLDIRLPDISGMEVLRWIRRERVGTVAVMVTAINNIDTAVEAMKLGAQDYIVKPFDMDKVYDDICSAVRREGRMQRSSDDETDIGGMEAIARSVEVQLEGILGYSTIVTRRTVEIARKMGMDEEIIMEWVVRRLADRVKRESETGKSPVVARRSLFAEGVIRAAGQQLRYPNLD